MNASAASLLRKRLMDLGEIFRGTGMTADEARTAIISCACAEAVCDRFPTAKGGAKGVKLLKFAAAWELVFGQAWETRERKERAAKRKSA